MQQNLLNYGYKDYIKRCLALDVLRVALAQIRLQNNQEKAIKHSLKLLNRIGSSESDIVCLPELWYSKILTSLSFTA